MTTYLLAGGGTAGHVNPLLASADEIVRRDPNATVIVLGTREGLESRLVPAAGFELSTVERLPFPRALSLAALVYPFKLARAVRVTRKLIRTRTVDVVVGYGGYASAPAYLAAWFEKKPIVIHEANAIPGIANKLGARLTRFVGVTFPGTPLQHATVVGMPLRREIEQLDRDATRDEARKFFGLDSKPVLVVTGGSTGAARLNGVIVECAKDILAAGWQIVHTVGDTRDFVDPEIPGYHPLTYCDRMDLAYAAADLVIARAGSATVSELSGLGIPAIFVPYAYGNGEQGKNAAHIVASGGAKLCLDRDFTSAYIRDEVVPLMGDATALNAIAKAAKSAGIRDGSARLADMIDAALAESAK